MMTGIDQGHDKVNISAVDVAYKKGLLVGYIRMAMICLLFILMGILLFANLYYSKVC